MLFHLSNSGDSLSSIQIPDSLTPNEINRVKEFKYRNNKLYSCIQTLDTLGAQINVIKSFFYELDITTNFSSTVNTERLINSFFPIDNDFKVILTGCNNIFSSSNGLIEKRDSNNNVNWSYCIHPNFTGLFNDRFSNSADGGFLFTSRIDSVNNQSYESVYYLKIDGNGVVLFTEQVIDNENISLFPNPVMNNLKIKGKIAIKEIRVMDLLGKIHISRINENNLIDVSLLDNGVYLIQLKTPAGYITRKFVKL